MCIYLYIQFSNDYFIYIVCYCIYGLLEGGDEEKFGMEIVRFRCEEFFGKIVIN